MSSHAHNSNKQVGTAQKQQAGNNRDKSPAADILVLLLLISHHQPRDPGVSTAWMILIRPSPAGKKRRFLVPDTASFKPSSGEHCDLGFIDF